MTAPSIDPALVTAGYTAQQQAARVSVLAYLAALWTSLASWRDPDAERFAGQAAPVVTGAQQHIAALTTAYLTQAVRDGGGVPPPAALTAVDDLALRGVPATEVYQRPFRQLWWDLSQGKPLGQAVDAAGARLQSLAATDLQLAKTYTSQRVLAGSGEVTGYRRVLTGDRSCALCVLASARTYHKAELMPLHARCDCSVAPLFGHQQAPDLSGDVHDLIAADIGQTYVSASGTGGPVDYRHLAVTHQHGELGPVLAVRGQAFTGPGDIPGG